MELSSKGFLLAMTAKERATLKELARRSGKTESNYVRNLLLEAARAEGIELDQADFIERGKGNRLPKENAASKVELAAAF